MDHKFEKFLAVVEARGFTAAAQQIHVSQPALSVTINELESDLGVTLLNRKKGHFGLTDAGQIVYDTARRLRAEIRAMDQILVEHNGRQVTFTVGMLDTVADLLLASGVVRDDLRGAEIKVDNSLRLLAEVRYGRMDVAVIAEQASPVSAGVSCDPIGKERYVFVGRPDIVAVTRPDYIGSWLAFNQASNTYAYFVKEFERYKITAVPSFYSTSMDLLKSMAMQGRGIALLPVHFCRSELATNKLTCLETPDLSRPLWVARPSDGVLSARANELITALSALLEQDVDAS